MCHETGTGEDVFRLENEVDRLAEEVSILKKRVAAGELIIRFHGIPNGCSECMHEATDFFCRLLNEPGENEHRREDCPFSVFFQTVQS